VDLFYETDKEAKDREGRAIYIFVFWFIFIPVIVILIAYILTK
jgi:hypothetical protein